MRHYVSSPAPEWSVGGSGVITNANKAQTQCERAVL